MVIHRNLPRHSVEAITVTFAARFVGTVVAVPISYYPFGQRSRVGNGAYDFSFGLFFVKKPPPAYRCKKPNASRDVVAGRYELCEDMASMLTETAKNMLFSLGITERDVLVRVHRGLVSEGAVVTPEEAVWVVHRLAELLDWSQLEFTF